MSKQKKTIIGDRNLGEARVCPPELDRSAAATTTGIRLKRRRPVSTPPVEIAHLASLQGLSEGLDSSELAVSVAKNELEERGNAASGSPSLPLCHAEPSLSLVSCVCIPTVVRRGWVAESTSSFGGRDSRGGCGF